MKHYSGKHGRPKLKIHPPRPLKLHLAGLLGMVVMAALLAGCAQLVNEFLPGVLPSATAGLTPTPTGPQAEASATPTLEPLATISGPTTLEIWVPPQFDPDSTSPAGGVLRARLDAFMQQNPGLIVNVRVKASSGPGSLLDSLTAASAAAPDAVPALIALNRADLELAALKGLIYSLGGLSTVTEDTDWYPYARQLAAVEETPYGLPFAGDALVMLYRAGSLGGPTPVTWNDVLAFGTPVIFQADDAQGLLTLDLYRSAGGETQDNQGRPSLTSAPLVQTLTFFEDGTHRGVFPTWVAQYQTSGQAWQAYQEKQADWIVTWSSNYLADLPEDTTLMLLPSLNDQAYTTATGWMWALSDPDHQRREMSVRLAEYLVDSGFLADWDAASGYLPTRPTSLSGWTNQNLQASLSQLVLSAQIRPANELIASLGPILRDASLAVIKGQSDAATAAQDAIDKLGNP